MCRSNLTERNFGMLLSARFPCDMGYARADVKLNM